MFNNVNKSYVLQHNFKNAKTIHFKEINKKLLTFNT